MSIIRRDKCRICESSNLSLIIEFKLLPFFDEIIPKEYIGKEFVGDMKVYFCNDCNIVQSLHDVNTSTYYNEYQYVASASDFIKQYMNYLANTLFKKYKFSNEDTIIEIGAADGYQLSCFKKLGAQVLGFEAATNLADIAMGNNIRIINKLFTEESINLIPNEFNKAKAVILLHTFDHLVEPLKILDVVKQVIDPDMGLLIIEVHDLQQIVEKRETALFGHEHTIFLHVESMKRLLNKAGFELIDADFIPPEMQRGSSMIIAAALKGNQLDKTDILDTKEYEHLNQLSTFEAFSNDVKRSFNHLKEYVVNKNTKGMRIAGYGGWGRGITTLSMANLTSEDLICVYDRNTSLHGMFTPATHLEIAPPERVFQDKIDEIIVFNYAYINEIKKQLQPFVDKGGKITSVLEILSK